MLRSPRELRDVLNSFDEEEVKTMYEDVEAVKRATAERLGAAKGTIAAPEFVKQMGSGKALREPQGRADVEA